MTKPGPADTATARKSALAVAGVLLAIATWNFYKERPSLYVPLGAAGGLLMLIGIAVPPAARAFHTGWMQFAAVLGWINSRIILSAMFFLVLAPIGFITRLFGRNPLNRRGPEQETYWIKRERTRQPREQFERLF